MASEIAAPKPDLDIKATKRLKGILKGKLLAPKLRQSSDKSLSQPGCSHFNNTIYNLQLQKTIVLRMQPRHEATLTQPHSNAICNHSFKKRIELRTQEEPFVAKHIGGTIRAKKTAAAPVAQTRYLSSSAVATLHGKTQGLVLRLPPQNIAHATFMQPLQCVSQHPVANPHLSTHVATSNDDNEAIIPMQSTTRDSRTAWNYAHRHNHSLQNT